MIKLVVVVTVKEKLFWFFSQEKMGKISKRLVEKTLG